MPNLIGTAPNQIGTNADHGSMAFQDENAVNIGGGSVQADLTGNSFWQNTDISTVQPTLRLDFDKMFALDPRITFGRASTAAYYDGKTFALAEQNLIPWSQQFDNAAWTKTSHTVVANATLAPDGTMTGYGYVASAATSTDFRLSGFASSSGAGVYTASCYFKKGAAQYAYLALTDSGAADRWAAATVDMSGGTITQTVNGAGITSVSSTIANVGNGWYRVTVTGTLAAASGIGLRCVYSNSSTPSLGSNAAYSPAITTAGGEFFYLWGAQLEQRSAVSAYTPTTSAAITNYIPALQTAAANQARFDFDPITGECKGFLVEEQRTNLAQYSEQPDNAYWTKSGATITPTIAVAPTGALTAAKMVESAANAAHGMYRGFTVSNSTAYTASVYAKAGERKWLCVNLFTTSSVYTYFDLQNGVIGTVGSGCTATMVSVGNGWYWCSVTRTTSSTYIESNYQVTTGNGIFNHQGDGWSGLYIFGMQLEAGSFATSYIPTTSAQVTRSRDDQNIPTTALGNAINASEGTLLAEFVSMAGANSAGMVVAGLYNGSVGVELYKRSSDTRVDGYYGSSLANAGAITANVFAKLAAAYSATQVTAALSGATPVSATVATPPPAPNKLLIGNSGGATNPFSGWIRRVTYLPKKLTNAELVELTQL